MVHWVMISGYEPFTAGSPQYEWILSDLKAVDRSATPWVVRTRAIVVVTVSCACWHAQV